MSDPSPLAARLAATIAASGPMPFPSFMAAALYDRQHGYYTNPNRTGRHGDFYTSVSTGPLFATLLATQFAELWESMGRPSPFHIVERGANNGDFAADVLSWSLTHRPDFHAAISYSIDEPLPSAAAAQAARLAPFLGKWQHDSPSNVTGVFFANELLDAVPFRRVVRRGNAWVERSVSLTPDGSFCWSDSPLLDRSTKSRLASLGDDFPDGYETEVAPAVASEVRLAAATIAHGALFFIDYGFTASDYYLPERSTGTLRCYRHHKAHENPFDAIGDTDITAHVDFSLAASAARAAGCHVAAFLDQARFLTGAATPILASLEGIRSPEASSWHRQFQSLTHPAHLGRSFQVLVLTKSPAPSPFTPSLSGLRFANPRSLAALAG